MNNRQLTALVNTCPVTVSRFQGVFAVDTLPDVVVNNSTYICNLDTSDNPGSHWISLYVPKYNKAPVEYFDSYGLDAPDIIEDTLLRPVYVYNKRSLQQPFSSVCGQYALYYVWQRPLHKSMNDVLEIFDECYQYHNDSLVNHLVEEHFDDDSSWIRNG